MRYKDEIDHWTTQLLKRFKKSTDVFINIILKKRYTMNDAKNRRKSREYVVKILRIIKFAEFESMTNQVIIIFNNLNVEFRRDLTKSINVLFMNIFFREMNDVKEIWWQLALRNAKIYKNRRNYQTKARNENFNRSSTLFFKFYVQHSRQYSSQQSIFYQSRNYQQFYHFKNQKQSQLSTLKQSLTIINSTTIVSTTSKFMYLNRYTEHASNQYENRQNKQKVY